MVAPPARRSPRSSAPTPRRTAFARNDSRSHAPSAGYRARQSSERAVPACEVLRSSRPRLPSARRVRRCLLSCPIHPARGHASGAAQSFRRGPSRRSSSRRSGLRSTDARRDPMPRSRVDKERNQREIDRRASLEAWNPVEKDRSGSPPLVVQAEACRRFARWLRLDRSQRLGTDRCSHHHPLNADATRRPVPHRHPVSAVPPTRTRRSEVAWNHGLSWSTRCAGRHRERL